MANKNFILMSMEDTKIKKISNVISNDSCRKILEFLAEKDSTESELAQKLGIAISTVHYNLLQLVDTGLIESTEFHYSKKGKEVSHYRLANKYIIIAPKRTFGLKERLKGILPVGLISLGTAGIIQFMSRYQNAASLIAAPESTATMKAVAQRALEEGAADTIAMQASYASEAAQITAPAAASVPNIALWFLAGALFAILLFFIVSIIKKA